MQYHNVYELELYCFVLGNGSLNFKDVEHESMEFMQPKEKIS